MPALTEGQLTALVALLSAVLGAAVALVAAILTNRANARAAGEARAHELAIRRQELNRSRGEELYTLLQTWMNGLWGYFFIKSNIMSGKLTYNEGLDLEIQGNKESKGQHVRIEMLIDVYFPELRASYDVLIKHREEAHDIVHVHRERYRVGETDGSRFLPALQEKQKQMGEAASELNNQILVRLRDA